MKRRVVIVTSILSLFVGALAVVAPTNAISSFNTKDTGEILLAKDAVHNGSYYAAGQDITIDGTITGDLYCAGQNLRITGTVKGDVICAVQKAVIAGTIGQDVRVAGQLVTVSGQVGGTLTSFAQDVELTKGATVAGDLNGAAQTYIVDGTIKRDMAIGAQKLTISGVVEGSASVGAETVQLSSTPAIKGGFDYTSTSKQAIPSGAIVGPVKFTQSETNDHQQSLAGMLVSIVIFIAVTSIVTSVILALVMPRYFERSYTVVRSKLGLAAVVGVAAVLGLPILAAMLLVSGVGALLAILVLAVLVVLNIVAFPFAAYAFARAVFGQVVHNIVLLTLAGSIVLAILLVIPVVNIFAYMAYTAVGVGTVLLTITRGYRKPQYSIVDTAVKQKK